MKNFSCGIIIGKLVKPRKIVWLTLSQEDSWRNEKYMQVLLFLNIYTGQWSMWVLTCCIIWGHEMFHMTVVKNSSYPQSKFRRKNKQFCPAGWDGKSLQNNCPVKVKWEHSVLYALPWVWAISFVSSWRVYLQSSIYKAVGHATGGACIGGLDFIKHLAACRKGTKTTNEELLDK